MSAVINDIGHGQEVIELPGDGKVTGVLNVAWLHGDRATVGGSVTYRDRPYEISMARFHKVDDAWEFQPENMMVPVRKPGGIGGGPPASPTFRDMILEAVSVALREAWSPDMARLIEWHHVTQQIRDAEEREAGLRAELRQVRENLEALRKKYNELSE